MGQQQVMDLLKANREKEWWTSKEIAFGIGQMSSSVTCNLKSMRKAKDVEFRKIRGSNGGRIYQYKLLEEY